MTSLFKLSLFKLSHITFVGTGGDGADTINISTASIILCAACGCKVAKAGNRSVSSQCGSADVLQELGIVIDLSPQQMAECNKRLDVIVVMILVVVVMTMVNE